MITMLALLMMQPPDVARGGEVFRQSCAIGYCHGREGAANRGPKLREREFNREYLLRVTREGISGTAMPGWKDRLKDSDVQAVVDYVLSLGGYAPVSSTPAGPQRAVEVSKATPDHPGRMLFFDATRVVRCGSCHRVEDRGLAVAANLSRAEPRSQEEWLGAMRAEQPKRTWYIALKNGESFVGLEGEVKDGVRRFWDLTGLLPVLRSVPQFDIKGMMFPGNWRHVDAVSSYTSAELETIAAYLATR